MYDWSHNYTFNKINKQEILKYIYFNKTIQLFLNKLI